MSQRAIRRAQQRRRRAALAAGAAISAGALFPPAASATNFPVTTTDDHAADACAAECTLRDAVTAANAAGNDTISFQAGVTGTIRLTQGEIPVLPVAGGDTLEINGPGRDVLTVSGDANNSGTPNAGDSRIFNVGPTGPEGSLTISGLTLTGGFALDANGGPNDPTGGGAMLAGFPVTLVDSAVTNSRSEDDNGGGGIRAQGNLTLTRSTLSGNTATAGQGGALTPGKYGSAIWRFTDSTISGNTAPSAGGVRSAKYTRLDDSRITGNTATTGDTGGIDSPGRLLMTRTTISGNTAATDAAGMTLRTKYTAEITNSVISGNTAGGAGGGMQITRAYSGAGPAEITNTTISGNRAARGGGISVYALGAADDVNLFRTTVSGNRATPGFGGGIHFNSGGATMDGDFRALDSTVSGNTAGVGGGVSVGHSGQSVIDSKGSIAFDNSTVAANSATSRGGGVYLNRYASGGAQKSPTVQFTSAVAADNTVGAARQDLDRANGSTAGGFSTAFSLVESPGDAPLLQARAGTNIVNLDPQLGPLASNGGQTRTHLPAVTSPLVDKGQGPLRLAVDQRGSPRTVDGGGVANARPGGDGTDIGAVELGNPPGRRVDRRPVATIRSNRLRARRRKSRIVRGTASDDRGVAMVEVAIVRRVRGGRCRELLEQGVFSGRRRCRVPRARAFFAADGKRRWKFRLERKLKRGRYVVYARATDNRNQKQRRFGRRSRRNFRVR
jgi:CSLREA domain-containing protein